MRALCVFLSCPLRDGHGQVGGMKEGNRARQQTKLPLETGPKLRTQQFLPSLFCTHNDNDKSDLIYPGPFYFNCFIYIDILIQSSNLQS